MSALHHHGSVRRRSCFWVFGLLALLGLAACGASDQSAIEAPSAEPHATEATAANVSQATAGAPRQPVPTTLDTPSGNVQPPSPPTVPAGPSAQPTEAAKPAPAPLPPAAPTAPTANTGAWQTYRNDNAGYSLAYPPGWTVREQNSTDGSVITMFAPGDGGSGVSVIAQTGTSNAAGPSDLPNTRCQQVTIGGLPGTRCRDTISFSISTTLAGPTKTFTIITTGKRMDEQIYRSIADSFVPL